MHKKLALPLLALLATSVLALTLGYGFAASQVSVVKDPKADWIGPGAPYSDIRRAKIQLVRTSFLERTHVRVSMVLDGRPPRIPSELYLAYVWSFDLDGIPGFNTVGDVNARVAWDGDQTHGPYFGWHAYLDGVHFAGIMFTFTIRGNTVTFTFPLSYIDYPTSFSWYGEAIQADVARDPTSTATWPSP